MSKTSKGGDAHPKLLWHSNAPWTSTGYGNQTGLIAKRLADHYRVGISAFYGCEGNVIPWNDMPVYPGIGMTHGNETIKDHAGIHFGGLRDGLVVTLMDVWVLDPAIWREFNVASWVPVDHEPVPEPVAQFFGGSGAVPIAMSRFGEEQLQALDPLYCPHGIDTKTYRPIPKAEARKAIKMPQDAFVVGMVAANKGNPSRKCFHEAFQAFKLLKERHDEALLYLHTEATGKFDGVNLPELIRNVGLDPDSVLFCDQYRAVHYPFPPKKMAEIYSSMDVLLAASAGEGFGIPVVEAQACGVPVIVSDFSAQPELCGAGWIVSGRKVYTPLKSWQFLPDIEDIHEALESAYSQREGSHADKAHAFALQYDVDLVLKDFMLPALEQASERHEDRKPVHPVTKARKKHEHKVAA